MKTWRACVPDEDGTDVVGDDGHSFKSVHFHAGEAAEEFIRNRQDEGSSDGDTFIVHIVEMLDEKPVDKVQAFEVTAIVSLDFSAEEIELEADEVSAR